MNLRKYFTGTSRQPDGKPEKVHEKYMSVIFTLVGTTQGLAIGALASKIPDDSSIAFNWENTCKASHFILCFAILARVTQAYICGALSYVQKKFSIIDITSVLFVGVVQYWIINSLSDENIIHNALYGKIAFLAAIAAALHYYALRRLRSAKNKSELDQIQIINITIAVSIAILSIIGFSIDRDGWRAMISLLMSIMLFTNIHISLEDTDFSELAQGRLYDKPEEAQEIQT